MGKIDMILNAMQEVGPIGITSNELAEKIGFSRTDIFAELNQLAIDGKLIRDDTKSPIRYRCPADTFAQNTVSLPETQTETDLDLFLIENASLKEAVCLAKSAFTRRHLIRGFMLLGEIGVGKQTFARYIFRHMIQTGMIAESAPFIFFNCPDALSDPNFSVKSLPELLAEAEGGILFLDEVHTLSAQAQTRLFSFMEGRDEHKPSLFLIAAATADPSLNSLASLIRRFSVVITLPPLSKRSMDERYAMLKTFLTEEASRCGFPISVSTNALRALLSYECPNNVSQLKSDIQLSCAKAYADYVSGKKAVLEIQTSDLMGHMRKGIYMGVEHRQQWNRLLGTSTNEMLFEPAHDAEKFEPAIYELIGQTIKRLRAANASASDIERQLRIEIDDFFAGYHEKINLLKENLTKIIGGDSFKLAREVLRYIENTLNRRLPQKLTFAFSLHIDNLVARLRSDVKIINKNNPLLQSSYPNEFSAAQEGLKIIERLIAMPIPDDDAGFLSLFFLAEDNSLNLRQASVRVIVIAHGKSTATSMADAANSLLGISFAYGIDAALDESPTSIYARLRDYIASNTLLDVLLLVDMGSLLNFGAMLTDEFQISVHTVPLVSTLHVLETTRKASQFQTLEKVYQSALNVNRYGNYSGQIEQPKKIETALNAKHKIVAICSSGEGTSKEVKKILKTKLKFSDEHFEIIAMGFAGKSGTGSELDTMSRSGKILCAVSSFDFDYNCPIFDLESIFYGSAIEQMQELIDIESAYLKLSDTLNNFISNVNTKTVVSDIESFISKLVKITEVQIPKSRNMGIIIHIACMIERLKTRTFEINFDDREHFITQNLPVFTAVKQEAEILNKKYNVIIPDDEICYLTKFFLR